MTHRQAPKDPPLEADGPFCYRDFQPPGGAQPTQGKPVGVSYPGQRHEQAYGGTQEPAPHQDLYDPDYKQWRTEQMRIFDEDYRNWRQDRFRRFAEDFNQWRRAFTPSGQSAPPEGADTAAPNKPHGGGDDVSKT